MICLRCRAAHDKMCCGCLDTNHATLTICRHNLTSRHARPTDLGATCGGYKAQNPRHIRVRWYRTCPGHNIHRIFELTWTARRHGEGNSPNRRGCVGDSKQGSRRVGCRGKPPLGRPSSKPQSSVPVFENHLCAITMIEWGRGCCVCECVCVCVCVCVSLLCGCIFIIHSESVS